MTWRNRVISAEAAASRIMSGYRVFLTGNCSTPLAFLNALIERHEEINEVEIIQLLDLAPEPYITSDIAEHIRINNLFIGPGARDGVNKGLADFTPIFLSEIPELFRSGRMVLDVAVIQVSPPDKHGFCSYGVEVGVTKTAAELAGMVIAEVNPNMPRSLGDSFIHVDQINYFVEVDYPLPEVPAHPITDIQHQIASHIAEYIPDGATLQSGIGGIPHAVLSQLTNHRDLGIHSEIIADSVVDMIESGIVTNARKSLHMGKVVTGIVLGTRKLFDYIDDNPIFELHPTEYVNDPFVIAQNDKMVSINSAIEVDITGQVCADSIGTRFYSGVGGQLDFVRGSARSKDGLSFIALPSTAKGGTLSRIVPQPVPGAGVTTSRNDVRMIVTEYGVADLWGLSIRERVLALTNIAHPDFREDLLRYAHEQNYLPKTHALAYASLT